MKKIIISLIIIILIGGYMLLPKNNTKEKANNIKEKAEIKGTKKQRDFILDNTLKINNNIIHYTSHFPNNYDKNKKYPIYFALPGWEGLYFQGLGENMNEDYPYEAQKYVKDLIVISPQLNDWKEKSANDTIELVNFFLNNYNIDKTRVYISGYSGGGETLSLVLEKRPELFTSALFISSKWDGKFDKLVQAKTPLYMIIGENDSYYGSTYAKNAYNELYNLYQKQNLTKEQIDKILVLDIKNQKYFEEKGYQDQHAGGNSFAKDKQIMNWIFSKKKG